MFATGASVGGTGPDSITNGDGSVWVEYANTGVSTGGGESEIVQYSPSGAVQHKYEIAGLVDGLKVDPVTGMVWALQNQDGNSTLSLINPLTHHVSHPLMYASPPYVYGSNSSRGYDDVAFLDGKVYLSYTNPVKPTDPVLQELNNGNNPSGTLTTTNILRASQTGIPVPDIDSLKSTPNGGPGADIRGRRARDRQPRRGVHLDLASRGRESDGDNCRRDERQGAGRRGDG